MQCLRVDLTPINAYHFSLAMAVFWAVTRCGVLGHNYLLPPNS